MRVLGFTVLLSLIHLFVSAQSPTTGAMAKDIVLPDAKNNNVALSSLKGKVVLIDFWASWCKPCRQTVPGLKKLYSKYHDKGFEIYGISLDDNARAWQKAVFDDGSKWLHVNDKDGAVANQWIVQVIPTSYLLDKTGKIVAVDEEAENLDKLLPSLLK